MHHNDIYRGHLILVNASYALLQNIKPQLVPIEAGSSSNLKNSNNSNGSYISMEIHSAKILSYLMEAVNCQGAIVPVSGYRSAAEQSVIYNDSLITNGADFTRRYVALPNHSEHQTGLAVDMALNQDNIDFIRPFFPYEGICHKFRTMAPQYGFIERYPRDKEAITGIAHEPWHFRYVGFPHSKIMADQGLTLEEYIDKLRSYPYDGEHYYFKQYNQTFEIFYVCLTDINNISIAIKDSILYQVSGNNVDGVIITLWRKDNE